MSSLNNFLNSAGNEYVRLLLIFVLVLIAVFLIFFLVRAVLRMMRGGSFGGKRARQPRLGFVEEAEIDARRRLILIRRDNVEHLILLGPTQDIVVESNIMKAFDGQKISPPARETYREPPPVVSEEQLSLKASARKAAGEPQILPPAPPAPARLSPPERPAPLAPKPAAAPQASAPAPSRFIPIPTTTAPSAPTPRPTQTAQYEEQVITLAPMPQPQVQKVSFDSLEDEMAALLGHKKA